jgi:ATP-dependent exoDNAse (exonuclease V) alpha subunit
MIFFLVLERAYMSFWDPQAQARHTSLSTWQRDYIDAEKRVVVCASTGAAAVRLHPSATSVHRKFGIPPRAKYLTPLFPGNYLPIDLFSADVIFIDEFSMLTRELLDFALYRLQQVGGPDVLKHKLVVLVGDHMQLPAVCFHT